MTLHKLGIIAFVFVLSMGTQSAGAFARVKTGLDVLVQDNFARLAGKRIGVITNHTAITHDRRHIVDLLASSPEVKLTAIFAPEHGLYGDRRGAVESGSHEATGVPVYSLYQRGSNRPTREMLRNVDVLIFDIQDKGTARRNSRTEMN
ncbi:MAG: exo-beta-N-acetylmuramidase NamZ domain-containing protein [Acidobacteriota bacterium]